MFGRMFMHSITLMIALIARLFSFSEKNKITNYKLQITIRHFNTCRVWSHPIGYIIIYNIII